MGMPTGASSRGVPSKSIAVEPYPPIVPPLRPSHVCFRRRGRPPSVGIALEQELSRNVAEAVAELLHVLCCGEESPVFPFASLCRHAALHAPAAASAPSTPPAAPC